MLLIDFIARAGLHRFDFFAAPPFNHRHNEKIIMSTDTQLNDPTPTSGNEVIASIDDKTPLQLFGNKQAIQIFNQIEAFARPLVFDCTTEKGKKECRSIDRKVAGAKNKLDKLAKEYIAELEQQIVPVKALRKQLFSQFESLQDDIKRPLKLIEEEEKQAKILKQELENEIIWIRSLGDSMKDGVDLTLEQLDENAATLISIKERLTEEVYGDLLKEAQDAHALASRTLRNSIIAANHLAQQQATKQQSVDSPEPSQTTHSDSSPQSAKDIMAQHFPEAQTSTTPVVNDTDAHESLSQKQMRSEAYSKLAELGFDEELARSFIGAVHRGLVPNVVMTYNT